MTRRDVLHHPDLNKVWVALESAAPTVDWDALARSPIGSRSGRRRIRLRRVVAVVTIVLLVFFLGSETVGVFAARRAIASGSAVSDDPVRLEMSTVDVAKPTTLVGSGSEEVAVDLGVTSSMIVAYVDDFSDSSSDNSWFDVLARLTPDGWNRLDVDLDHVVDSTFVGGREIILGFGETLETVGGHESLDRNYAVYEIPMGSDRPRLLHVFDEAPEGTVFRTITGNADGLFAASWSEGSLRLWHSTEGETWTASEPFASGAVNSSTTRNDNSLYVGYDSGLIPVEEFGTHAIWAQTDTGKVRQEEIAGLRSQGFGYVIGGFRLSDGLEEIVAYDGGLVAYSGYLQVWDGFADGIILEPSESWSSLVVTSSDGTTWESHLQSDFAINRIIPFGNGLLATAARQPESDTITFEAEDGTTQQVAVSPPAGLYYSEDGLIWNPVEDSPEFSKPLLVQTGEGQALVVDEHQVEDPDSETATVHQITAP